MMDIEFKGLDHELIMIVDSADKMDHFYILEMLVLSEALIESNSSCEYFVTIMTLVQAHMKSVI